MKTKVVLYSLLMLGGSILGFARGAIFAKVLGPEMYGHLTVILIIMAYGTDIIHLGLLNGLNRELPVSLGRGEYEYGSEITQKVFTAISILGVVFSLIYIGYLILFSGITEEFYLPALIIAPLLVMANVFYQFALLELRAHQKIIILSLAIFLQALLTAAMGYLLGMSYGLLGIVISYGAVLAFTALYTRYYFRTWKLVAIRLGDFKKIFGIGLPLLLSALCFNLMITVDKIFIAGAYDLAVLGIYQFASLVASGGFIISATISQYVSPKILHEYGQYGSIKKVFLDAARIALLTLAAFAVMYIPVILTVEYLVVRYFAGYVAALPAIKAFYFGAAFSVMNLFGIVLNAAKKTFYGLICSLVSVAIILLLCLWAVKGGAGIVYYSYIFAVGQALLFTGNCLCAAYIVKRPLHVAAVE